MYLPEIGSILSLCLIGFKVNLSKLYTNGIPVGIFNSVITLSGISSKYLINALKEFP